MRLLSLMGLALVAVAPLAPAAGQSAPRWPVIEPAQRLARVAEAPLLAAAYAGRRLVAVGDHGVILLSDDGTTFRQAKAVPVRAMLTSLQFLDAKHGYAAGHDGVLLETLDGGETWSLLRATPGIEQPVLAFHFDSVQHGIAVGLYGWAIETRDGGRTWTQIPVGSGDDADRHLLHVFASGSGTLFIAAEGGAIFRSADGGRSWQAVATGKRGALWFGRALADGALLVCGMRGHLYRSADDGRSWQAVESHTTQSLTGIATLTDGSVLVSGLAGTVLRSVDGGSSFSLAQREGREALTGVLADGTRPMFLSMSGPLGAADPASRSRE